VKRHYLQLSLCAPLAVAVVISGVWAIKTKHQARQLFVELESLNRERDRLQVDWGRWQLEESALGNHSLVESLARDRLSMARPQPEQIIVVAVPVP
jgi:cell division protein FtsL